MSRAGTRTLALGGVLLAAGAALATIVGGWPARSGPALTVGVALPAGLGLAELALSRERMTSCPDACDSTAVVALRRRDVARARRWLRGRAGRTALAVLDGSGRLSGVRVHERFRSASLVKAMLLVAYLDQAAAEGRRLEPWETALLDPMIRVSDNAAASAIFAIVGETGLQRLAQEAEMRDFATSASWGYTEVSAADQARFFGLLDRLVPRRFAPFARRLLSGVVAGQSWGIPAAARPAGFKVLFKGGWLEGIVVQAARLERRGAALSLAILTDGNPSMAYGEETLEGATDRLLGRSP